MTTVNVILAAEQRGGLVEQGRRNGRKITGQAVDLLVDVRLPRWVYVKGVFNQGLDNRRAREMAWCLQGAN